MNKYIPYAICALFLFSVANIDSVRPFYMNQGDELDLYLNIEKNVDYDIDNIRLAVYIPDLDVYGVSNRFDLEDDRQAKTMFVDMPRDVEPGTYLMRIFMTNDDDHLRTVKHWWLDVY